MHYTQQNTVHVCVWNIRLVGFSQNPRSSSPFLRKHQSHGLGSAPAALPALRFTRQDKPLSPQCPPSPWPPHFCTRSPLGLLRPSRTSYDAYFPPFLQGGLIFHSVALCPFTISFVLLTVMGNCLTSLWSFPRLECKPREERVHL